MTVAHAVTKHSFIQQIDEELAVCQAPSTSDDRRKSCSDGDLAVTEAAGGPRAQSPVCGACWLDARV